MLLTHVHTCRHAHVHTCTHIHMHAHMHTCTQRGLLMSGIEIFVEWSRLLEGTVNIHFLLSRSLLNGN